MSRSLFLGSLVVLFALPAVVTAQADAKPAASAVPLYENLGSHHRKITTASDAAQAYFDQGLVWAYAFNHDEAIRLFREAARHDPQCAMAWWGIALCYGPHINRPLVPPEHSRQAWSALQKAIGLKAEASPLERELIDALATRYSDPPPEDRAALNQAYADAMCGVWEHHSADADVGTLCAEALMNLRPWGLWATDGQPQPGTERIEAMLSQVLKLAPDHPGANHLYIHVIEPSPHPERATAAADRLRNLVPAASHLVHMPSHIDVLTGRWAQASRQNELAIEADARYRKLSPRQDFYHVYMMHNHHMLAFASMMEGRREVALRAARQLIDSVPEEYAAREPGLVDPYLAVAYDVMKRFGMWEEILREPAPAAHMPITTAMWRFTRGLAFAAQGQVAAAEREHVAFREAAMRVPEDALLAINPARQMLEIADGMLRAEIDFRRGEVDSAVAALRRAAEQEDALLYMEPPEWIQPVRHTLGAFLLEAGRFEEAEAVYREDLAKWPNNGWSLYGLGRSLRGQGDLQQAQAVEAEFRQAWSRADTQIGSSCLCVQ